MFYFITILLVKSRWPLPVASGTGIPHCSHLIGLDPSRPTPGPGSPALRLTGPLPREQVPSADFPPGSQRLPPCNPFLTSWVNQPKHSVFSLKVNVTKTQWLMWLLLAKDFLKLVSFCCCSVHQIIYSLSDLSSYDLWRCIPWLSSPWDLTLMLPTSKVTTRSGSFRVQIKIWPVKASVGQSFAHVPLHH